MSEDNLRTQKWFCMLWVLGKGNEILFDMWILYTAHDTGHYPVIPCLMSLCFDDAMHGRGAPFV